jgi:hypothetical protein
VYKIRDAVRVLYKKTIAEKVAERVTSGPGTPEYLGQYTKVLSEVHDGLSKEDMARMEETVEIWNKKGAPEELKKK